MSYLSPALAKGLVSIHIENTDAKNGIVRPLPVVILKEIASRRIPGIPTAREPAKLLRPAGITVSFFNKSNSGSIRSRHHNRVHC